MKKNETVGAVTHTHTHTQVSNNKKEKNIKKINDNGVTLIALVITIIILLILATVSITMLFGNDGIITRAQDAQRMQDLGEIRDAVVLKKADNMITEHIEARNTTYPGITLTTSEVVAYTGIIPKTGAIYKLINKDYEEEVFTELGANTKKRAYVVCYETGEAYEADMSNGDLIRFNLDDGRIYPTETSLTLIRGIGINVTVNGNPVPLNYDFLTEGEYIINATGASFLPYTITINISDNINDTGEIEIWTVEQLKKVATGIVNFTNDIVYEGQVKQVAGKWNYADDYIYKMMADINLNHIANWIPIAEFNGFFEGNNHVISNMNIISSINNRGLFEVNNGIIKNLKLNNANIYNTATYTGGLVGSNYGEVSNVIMESGNISGHQQTGGIVGNNIGTIVNCGNNATINYIANYSYVGGIVGYNTGSIERCYNYATITGGNIVGGVVGHSSGVIKSCYNIGNVRANMGHPSYSSNSYVGGIAGVSASQIIYCYNVGAISASQRMVGGIMGQLTTNSAIATNCYNSRNSGRYSNNCE